MGNGNALGSSGSSGAEYAVCFSYASEDRKYVEETAAHLRGMGISLFDYQDKEAESWGLDLHKYLEKIYKESARLCVVFISEHYARKKWPKHELKSARRRALEEKDISSPPGSMTRGYGASPATPLLLIAGRTRQTGSRN